MHMYMDQECIYDGQQTKVIMLTPDVASNRCTSLRWLSLLIVITCFYIYFGVGILTAIYIFTIFSDISKYNKNGNSLAF